jgi:hypothetical protein
MMGYGQKARIRAERVCSRLRDTPEKPGEAWGPTCSVTRRDGTESPRVVLIGARRAVQACSSVRPIAGRKKPGGMKPRW